jgi:hypothetical protein
VNVVDAEIGWPAGGVLVGVTAALGAGEHEHI